MTDKPDNVISLRPGIVTQMNKVERRLRESADHARDIQAENLVAIYAKGSEINIVYVAHDPWRILGMLDLLREQIIRKHIGVVHDSTKPDKET